MKRTWLVALLACVVPAGAWGAQPASVGAVYVVDFQVHLARTLPAGALVTCKVKILPEAPGQTQQVVTGLATVQGSSAHCAVEVPATSVAPARLSYEIDAAEPRRAGALLYSASGTVPSLLQLSPGGAARLDLSLTL